jgi:hypothetical protein
MKKTILSILTITGGILLSLPSFAANISNGQPTSTGVLTNPMFHPEVESSFIGSSNTRQTNARFATANPMLHPELETSSIVVSEKLVAKQGQTDEHYGLAPSWNHQDTGKVMGNPMLRPEIELSFMVTSH